MTHYVIRITEYNDKGDNVNAVAIELDTVYTLVRDLSEWVKEEIDANAQFLDLTPEVALSHDCDECQHGNHEDCRDGNRVSAVPFECGCAIRRHDAP